MYKIPLLLMLLWAPSTFISAQDIIWKESFETEGDSLRYNSSSTFYDGTNDYFRRTDGSDISIIAGSYSAQDGRYFWAGEDLDDAGDPANDGLTVKELIFKPVNTSSYTDLKFSGLFAAGNDGGAGASTYDDEDSVVVYYSINGGDTFQRAIKFVSIGDQSNEPIAWDTDFDAIGDSTVLSPVFTFFGFEIPDADSIIIKINVSVNAGSEEIAFDYFTISGSPNGITPLPTKASFSLAADTINESQANYNIPVFIENPSDTVHLLFSLTEESSFLTSYDTTLQLIGTVDSILINQLLFEDNHLIDGHKTVKFYLCGISGGYQPEIKEPSLFSLTILDDDIPVGGEVIISEIMYDSKSSTDEEWVELFNTTENPINISGWYLTDDDSYPADGEGDVVFPDSTIISAREYLIISWKHLTDPVEYLLLDKNTGTRSYAPGLSNTGDNLALYSNAVGTGVLVDGSDTTFYNDDSPVNAGFSIERNLASGYTNGWKASVNHFNGAEIIKATPGEKNSTHYTSISFGLAQKEVTEDSLSISVPVAIRQPSDTSDTYIEVILLNGDSTEIEGFQKQQLIFPSASSADQEFIISITDDSEIGKTDTLTFQITSLWGGDKAYIAEDSLFQLIIHDNDFTEVNFTKDSVEISEGDSLEVFLSLKNFDAANSTELRLAGGDNDLLYNRSLRFDSLIEKSLWLKPDYDAIEEGDEFLELSIAEVSGGNKAFKGPDSLLIVKVIDDNPTQVSFADSLIYASEDEGSFVLILDIAFPKDTTSATIALTSGNLQDISHFNDTTIYITGTRYFLEIPISNDLIRENKEGFDFQIESVSGGNRAVIGSESTATLFLTDDEAPAQSLVINELLYDPPADSVAGDANNDGIRDSADDEFVEIVNVDSMAVDLSGFSLNDAAKPRHNFVENTILQPNQAIIIFGGGTPAGNFGGSVVQTASSGALSLNNSGDQLYLIATTDTITSLIYSGDIGSDQSITRSPDITGDFVDHSTVSDSLYSAGFQHNWLRFDEKLPDPEISLDTSGFDGNFGLVYYGDTSVYQSYFLTGRHLRDSIAIQVPFSFELSTDQVNWHTQLIFVQDSLKEEIFVRFIPPLTDAVEYFGEVRHLTSSHGELSLSLYGKGKKKPAPKIFINTSDYDFGCVVYKEDAESFFYTISARELLDSLKISSSDAFLISLDNKNFTVDLKIPPKPDATIDTTIFVQFNGDVSGAYEGEILHHSTDADTAAFKLAGNILSPVIMVSSDSLDFQKVVVSDSSYMELKLQADALAEEIEISGSENISVSINNNIFHESLQIAPTDQQVDVMLYIRYIPEEVKKYEGFIKLNSYGADTVKVKIMGEGIQPDLSLQKNNIDFGTTISSEIQVKSYSLKGNDLLREIFITAPEGFKISSTPELTDASSQLIIPPQEDIQLFVGFYPASEKMFSGGIKHFSYGADTVTLEVSGERLIPVLEIDKSTISFTETPLGEVSDLASYHLYGKSIIDSVLLVAPTGFEMDKESIFNHPSDSIYLSPLNKIIDQEIFIRFVPEKAGSFADSISHSGSGFENLFLPVNGTGFKITDVEQQEEELFSVYPVPADELLNIHLFKSLIQSQIAIINSAGQIVYRGSVNKNANINTSEFSPGSYQLVVITRDKIYIRNIVVVH